MRFANLTSPVLAHRCLRVLLELEVLICTRNVSFAVQSPAKAQQIFPSLFLASVRGTTFLSGLVGFSRRCHSEARLSLELEPQTSTVSILLSMMVAMRRNE